MMKPARVAPCRLILRMTKNPAHRRFNTVCRIFSDGKNYLIFRIAP